MKLFRFNTIIAGLIGAILLVGCENSKTQGQTQSSNTDQSQHKVTKTGQSSAKTARAVQRKRGIPTVILTEYADFQCPTCKSFSPIVHKLEKAYGDTLIVRYRYFPLRQHRYSRLAARAAQSAKNQGKFWAMHDMLFKNQDEWANSRNAQKIFIGYAKKLGLDLQQFKNDLNAAKTERIVMQQKKEGQQKGIHATPTFFINGEMMVSLPRSYKQFKALLDIYVNEAVQAANNS